MPETSSTPPTAVSSPRTQRKRPADFTGIQAERLAEEKKEEVAARAKEIALVHQEQEEQANKVVDYTGADTPLEEVVIAPAVEINEPYRTIRVNTKIEQMTFGRQVVTPERLEKDPSTGETIRVPAVMGSIPQFNFDEGVSYRVPKEMADHLQRLGYLSYIGT